jgi:hypothetical protein
VLRIEHFGHTGNDWVISVYDDGRILAPGTAAFEYEPDAWMLVRRLTPEGVDALIAEIVATGLFESDGSYDPVLLPGAEHPGRGASGYRIHLVREAGEVDVGWVSLWGDDDLYYEPSPEREQLDALGARLLDLDTWLSDSAWAERDRCVYEAQAYQVVVQTPQPQGGSLDDLPVDVADIEWPPGGEILSWGEPFSAPGTTPDIDGRCGGLPRMAVASLLDYLVDAGAESLGASELDVGPWIYLRLGYRELNSVVDVTIRPLRPDETACTAPSAGTFGI